MARYIHLFETEAKYEAVRNGGGYVEPWVSYTEETEKVNYNKSKSEYEKLLETPLSFEIHGDGDIVWKANNSAYTVTLEYKKNDGEWTEITSNTGNSAPTIAVVSGDTVEFRGNNATMSSGSSRYSCFSGTTCSFSVKGNVMSLLNKTGFTTATTLSSTYVFKCLFSYCTGLTDASKLVLPATTLATQCYAFMFQYCTSLTTAPELPATALTTWCYANMFLGCTGLTIAPELPATTLVQSCYNGMFRVCTSLNYIKCLATDISAYNCTTDWVQGVASAGTFVTPSTTDWLTGDNGIPSNWTVQDA